MLAPGFESLRVHMPFAGYKDFDTCVKKNADKKDPRAYCGAIMAKVEGTTSRKKKRES